LSWGDHETKRLTPQRGRAVVEDDMVDDAALWFLLATGIAFIWWGCFMTAKKRSNFDF
jgi:hypothetical protein